MTCRIEKLVREAVDVLDEAETVETAVKHMADRNLGSVVVTRDNHVAGLFTERDLVTRVVGLGKNPSNVPLRDVCSTDLVSIAHDSSCQEAIRTMHTNLCRRLLVYRDGKLLGLVRLPDVANELAVHSTSKNFLVNLFGGITLAVTLGVIVMLLLQLPNMLDVVDRVTR